MLVGAQEQLAVRGGEGAVREGVIQSVDAQQLKLRVGT